MSHNMVNFGLLAAEIDAGAPPMFDRATITLGTGPHSSIKKILKHSYYSVNTFPLVSETDFFALSGVRELSILSVNSNNIQKFPSN